jgi:hypothetical protein
MAGRIAGLNHLIEPLAFTGLSYGIGKLAGQSDQQALTEAVGGVGGAYAVQHAASKVFPQARFKLPSRKPVVPGEENYLNYAGVAGSVLGGMAGVDAANWMYRQMGGTESGGEVNPLFYAVDEAALPLVQVAKGFV